MERFIDQTTSKYGGYGRSPDAHPDVMHSYMGIVAFSIGRRKNLPQFFSPLGVSAAVHDFAQSLGFCSSPKRNDEN
jgi:hypothetical protein